MAKVNKDAQEKISFSARLLRKLHLCQDMRLEKNDIEVGMFKHFWGTFKSNMTSMFANNLMFLLFALPIVIFIFFIMPLLEQKYIIDNNFNFVGDLGLGFIGATNDTLVAMRGIYNMRILYYLTIIPGFTLMGIGASGLFYCMRNKVWGANTKVFKHFFRGVKKYWWQFMLAFTFIGVVVYGFVASIQAYLLMSVGATAPWWIWLVMVLISILALLTLVFMIVYLPTINMYRMKNRYTIKNSLILSFISFVPAVIMVLLLAIPFAMMAWMFTKIIFMVLFGLYGFSFYALAVQCFGQFNADKFTNYLYDQSIIQAEREKRKRLHMEKRAKQKSSNKKGGKKR